MKILFIVLLSLLAVDLAAVACLTIYAGKLERRIRNEKKTEVPSKTELLSRPGTVNVHYSSRFLPSQVGPASIGKAHNIGCRPVQQDSFGNAAVFQEQGVLAVVADGMGGLSGGEQVSQRIVMKMLALASELRGEQMEGVLLQMLRSINQDINQMLGQDGLYKSGSTLLAVLAKRDCFQWIAVGDSRIYLYRDGCLLKLNQEHNLLQEWMPEILDGKMTYSEALQNPEGKKLTSFVGMGRIKHVDCSLSSISIIPGDRILLMSDGIFNTLTEPQMAGILKQYTDVQQAANVFEQQILAAQIPTQDNFTVVILGF